MCTQNLSFIWVQVYKNGPSKVYGRQFLKKLKGYGLLKQTCFIPECFVRYVDSIKSLNK